VFLPADMPAYQQASARVMATLRTFPVLLQVHGRDEAFVGGDPQRLPTDLKTAVHDRAGLTCAIGMVGHSPLCCERFCTVEPYIVFAILCGNGARVAGIDQSRAR
jgi:hypothetical protein